MTEEPRKPLNELPNDPIEELALEIADEESDDEYGSMMIIAYGVAGFICVVVGAVGWWLI